MRLPQFGIGGLMALAAVVAADVAASRTVVIRSEYFSSALRWLVATMPVAIALQCILLWLRAGQSRARIFWIGALIFGTAGLASVVWHLSDPPSETVMFSTSGTSRQIDPGSPAARVWEPYLSVAYEGLDRLGLRRASTNRWISTAQDALVFFLPQLLVALTGGLIAQKIANRLFPMQSADQVCSPSQTIGADDRQPERSGPPSETRSHNPTGSATWLKQLTSVVAIFVIAMIASGMPFRRDQPSLNGFADFPELPLIVDDLKYIELPTDAKLTAP